MVEIVERHLPREVEKRVGTSAAHPYALGWPVARWGPNFGELRFQPSGLAASASCCGSTA
jgi:hypothetical protein